MTTELINWTPTFAPGPFAYCIDRDGCDDVIFIYRAENRDDIAEIRFWDDGGGYETARQEANARLLTAGPDLFDAVRHVLAVWQQGGSFPDLNWSLLIGATAKVKGVA